MKAIINLDKVKYPDVVTAKNGSDVLENGAFVALGGLVQERLGRDCYAIAKLSEGCKLGYVADVALMYDETKDERDFRLEANQIGRVRRFPAGGGMTIARKHVSGTVNKGDFLALKASSYQLEKTTDKSLTVAQVLEVTEFNGQPSYYIEFVR